jgi:hypothetical protein
VKTTPHATRGNKEQARGILQIANVTEQRANELKIKLLQQDTWRETYSSKQMDDTPCEVEQNFTKEMKNFNGFYLIKCSTACDFSAY